MIEEKIRKYLAENILFEEEFPYSNDTSFSELGVIDSNSIMELVFFVEEEFKITMSDNDLRPQNFDSVANVATYIRSKQAG